MVNTRPSMDGLQRLLRSRKPSARSLSTCPVTGTSSVKNEFESKNVKSRPYSEIPGPKMYPLLGSLLDFKDNGASLLKSSLAYYEKYGMIAKQNLTGDEVIIFDPREYIKGDQAQCTCLNVCIWQINGIFLKYYNFQYTEQRESIPMQWRAISGHFRSML